MAKTYSKEKAHYIVVTGIIVKDGKYLITKRAEHEAAFPGRWTVPGGKLEMQDYANRSKDIGEFWYNVFRDLLRREIKEEVNLEIKNIRYLTDLVYVRSDGIPTVIVSLYADYAGGEVKLCDDLSDYRWVSLQEASQHDLIEGIYQELEMLEGVLRSKSNT